MNWPTPRLVPCKMSMSGGKMAGPTRESNHSRLFLMMNDTCVMSMEELQAFLNSSDGLKFSGCSRPEAYGWIEKTLRQYQYLTRPRVEKGLLRQYLQKMSGYSPAQLTRLIDQFHCSGHLRVRPYRRHCFPTKFTWDDQLVLLEVDEVHERLLRPGYPSDPQAGIRAVWS